MSIVRLIIEMLQIFNIDVDESSVLKIKDNDFLNIYDKEGNEIGKILKKDNGFKAEIINENYYLELRSYKNDISCIKYKLYLRNNKMLLGNTKVCFGKRYNDFVRKTNISIFENKERTNSYYFDTIENKFNFYDLKSEEKVFYRNNRVYHEDDKKSICIDCDRLNVNYKINEKESDRLFNGNLLIHGPYVLSDYSIIDCGINYLLNKFDSQYFEFLDEKKKLLNEFSNNLFENFCKYSLKNFNDKQFDLLLDIRKEGKGNKLIKKII